jgi:uncharacterized repeat protein (TIGR03803 family)
MSSLKVRCFNSARLFGIGCALVLVLLLTTAIAAPAQTFNTLINFDGTNGCNPEWVSLVQGRNGNLYGVTTCGGSKGDGIFFKMTPGGTLTVLHSFEFSDGAAPFAGVTLASDGNFYGTTAGGGVNGYGTAFKVTPSGTVTTLYSFCAQPNCADGSLPTADLVQATNGNFYGTTFLGGAYGDGTAFKITPGGKLTTLNSFDSTQGGPYAGLVQATNGNLYGTTYLGGAYNYGTIFKITPGGKLKTVHDFNFADGVEPVAGLIQAADGNLYGTTSQGGANGHGTEFKVTPRGKLTVVYSFCAQTNCADGADPWAGLVQATDGNFYGATSNGGANGYGTIFQITSDGVLTTLHSFDGTDGADCWGAMVQATQGEFYGTTQSGGNSWEDGTVFSLSMGLGPFVAFVRDSGKVAQKAQILGQGFTGTTGVSFNGTPANFTVRRDTYLVATVPQGATTGYVTVTTPSGTLQSNVKFRVLK